MRGLPLAIALLLLAAAPALASPGPVSATATLDKPWIRIGDPVLLTLVVEAPAGYQVLDPGVGRAVGPFELLETLPARQERLADAGVRLTFRYRITIFALGDYALPPIEVVYLGPGGEGTVRTEEQDLSVKSVAADFEDLSEIKPLAPQLELAGRLASILTRLAVPVAAAVAILLPAIGALRARRRLRRPAVAPPQPVAEPTTPARRALGELQRIADLGLPAEGRLAEHYELLNEALRRYLADKFGLAAGGRTARELLVDMQRAGVDPRQAVALHEILRDRELVRFQGFAPYPRHAEQALRIALDVVRRAAAAEGPPVRELDIVSAGAP